jgi:hypothetical protein
VVPSCPRHTRLLDPGCRVAGEQFIPHRRLKFAMASMGKVRNEGQRTMPGVRDLPADPLPARLSERRSMPGRSTSALLKVETDSALERPRTKDVRRVMSPFAARVPVNAAGWHTGTGLAQVLPETARRGDDRQTFLLRSSSMSARRHVTSRWARSLGGGRTTLA